MLDLKLLNTILFNDKELELKTAIQKINNSFEPEKAKKILSYAKVYNKSISFDIELDALPEIVSNEEIINHFYNSEKISPFLVFQALHNLKKQKNLFQNLKLIQLKKLF